MRFRLVCTLSALAGLASFANCQFMLQTYASGFLDPLQMVQDATRPDIQYVVQKEGLIRVVQNGTILGTNFIDLSSQLSQNGQKFLFNLTFSPDYATSGKAYVCYVDNDGIERVQRILRSTQNPLQLDPNTSTPVILIPPSFDHWGGTMHFGPDGYLYIGLGDGDVEGDPNNLAQDPNGFHGKMLRIDPNRDDFPADANRNYGIPPDNPFLDGNPITALPEIWAFGYRNPWKWSFDMPALGGTGAMIVGDVGNNNWEEVDYEPAGTGGRNYGWRQREGLHDSGLGGAPAYLPFTDPVYNYAHIAGVSSSITGGYVYRGSALPAFFYGRYFYADFERSLLVSLKLQNGIASDAVDHTPEIGDGAAGLAASIDLDSHGEMYIVDISGKVNKVVMQPSFAPTGFSIVTGRLISGGLSSLANSDDSRLVIANGIASGSGGSPLNVEFTATAPSQTVSSLSFTLEGQVSEGGLSQTLELFDYSANSWVALDSRPASPNSDIRTTCQTTNPNRFIQSGTLKVRGRVRITQTGILAQSVWQGRFDQVLFSYQP